MCAHLWSTFTTFISIKSSSHLTRSRISECLHSEIRFARIPESKHSDILLPLKWVEGKVHSRTLSSLVKRRRTSSKAAWVLRRTITYDRTIVRLSLILPQKEDVTSMMSSKIWRRCHACMASSDRFRLVCSNILSTRARETRKVQQQAAGLAKRLNSGLNLPPRGNRRLMWPIQTIFWCKAQYFVFFDTSAPGSSKSVQACAFFVTSRCRG